jgi:hypothetical protein
MLLIVVSPHHQSSTPLKVSLGRHTLMITSEKNPPKGGAGTKTPAKSISFDNDEAYQLYLCLHELFQAKETAQKNSCRKTGGSFFKLVPVGAYVFQTVHQPE